MIESSFCFLWGVGRSTERQWLEGGIGMWADFLSSNTISGMGPSRKTFYYDEALGQTTAHRQQEDARFLRPSAPS